MKKTIVYTVALIGALASFSLHAENAVSIDDVEPIYPKSALERKLTGWVVVDYTVNEDGHAENITIADSEPAKVFDGAAKRAIKQTRFSTASEAVEQSRKFVFEIDEEIPGSVAAR